MPFRRRPAAPRAAPPAVPPDLPPEETPPEREIWPWLAAFLILVLGGLAAGYVLSRDDDDGARKAATVTQTSRRLPVPPPTNTTTTDAAATERTTTATNEAVAVPRVVGLRREAAAERLAEAKLGTQVREVFAERPEGVVVRQRPRPDQEVDPGTRILLEVSQGPPPAPVPNVVGATEQDAAARLDAAGFGVVVYDVPSAEPKGRVVAQEPKAGEEAASRSRVRINVSTGVQQGEEAERPESPTVTVPDVVGKKRNAAAEAIRRAGLKPDTKYVPSAEPADTVVAQSPKPGRTAERGSGVRINISKGPKPKADVAIPNVEGKDEQSATAQLEAAGFVVEVVQQDVEDPAEEGIVLEQTPAAGERAPQGATVTIVVGFLPSG